MNGLTETDYSNLRQSFIPPELVQTAQLRRVSDEEGADTIGRPRKAGTNYAGIVFPYFLPPNYDCPREYRLRRDKPDLEHTSDSTVKEKGKYLAAPGTKNMIYFPPGCKNAYLADASLPVVITEGEKKTLALHRAARHELQDAADKPGFLALGLSGVWNFRGRVGKTTDASGARQDVKGLIPDFHLIEWKNRKATILFDANISSNESVRAARQNLAKELTELGANVFLADCPEIEGCNGIDDVLGRIEKEQSTGEAVNKCFEVLDAAQPLKKEKASQATQILSFSEDLELFHTSDQETFATIEMGGHIENQRLNSKAFRSWLSFQFFQGEGKIPSTKALQDAIGTLEGKALFEGEEKQVFIRLASFEDKIYLDLCNDVWQIVEISKGGWRIIEAKEAPVRFRRTKAMLPLPTPVADGDIAKIKQFLNVNDSNYVLILAWLVNCFRPDYPFPVLILSGEQGSAKSTTSRLLRELVDPNKTAFRSAPRDERDLVIAASNAWVCAFDNLSTVQHWLSDALCRISTGGGFATRTLYENDEETIFTAKRPILINGIGELASRSDLLDRALLVHLEQIPETRRQPESEFWQKYENEKPIIFSGLLTAVSLALQKIGSVKLDRFPRMADFALWATAAESGLGLSENSFLGAYTVNRENVNETALEGSPVADTVKKFCEKNSEFEGTLKDLLTELDGLAGDEAKKSKEYPKTPRALRSKLERINPNLRAIGIDIKFLAKSEKGRLVKIEYTCIQPSGPSGQSASPKNKAHMAVSSPSDSQPPVNQPSATMSQPSGNNQPSANRQDIKSNEANSLGDTPDDADGTDGHLHSYSNGNGKAEYVDMEI